MDRKAAGLLRNKYINFDISISPFFILISLSPLRG